MDSPPNGDNDDDTVTTQFVFYFLAITYSILSILTMFKIFPYLLRSKTNDQQAQDNEDNEMNDKDLDRFSEKLIIEKSP